MNNISSQAIHEATIMNSWFWSGEPGFIKLIQDNQKPNMKVAEIGCYDGSTTRKYIDVIKKNNGHLYIIDTFMGTVPSEFEKSINPNWSKNHHAYGNWNLNLYDKFMKKFSKYSDMMTVMKGTSEECIPLLPDDLDIIFIDADHRYSAVKLDIDLSLKKLKKGGILSGHDCESFELAGKFPPEVLEADYWQNVHPGVVQAVYEKFGVTNQNGVVWYTTVD